MADDNTTDLPSPGLSLLFFLIVTLGYFVYRYKSESDAPTTSPMVPTMAYFLLIVIGEFFINNQISKAICGESQWALSLTITLIPWVLIFALLLLFLNMFPSWNVPFSNTFGLFVAKMMGLPKLVENIFNFPKTKADWASFTAGQDAAIGGGASPGSDSTQNPPFAPSAPPLAVALAAPSVESEKVLQALANIKLDNSIIINEFTEANFDQLWGDLQLAGLLSPGAGENQAQFKSMIHAKTLVAEFLWFLLTGMLVTSVSYNYIINSGCKTSLAEMQKTS